MSRTVLSLLLAAALAACAVNYCSAMPADTDNHRVKRMSDHRVAELQTLLSMGKMGGKVVTHKVGYGQVDPMKVGRRRRSDPRMLSRLQQLLLSAAAGDSHEQLPEQEEEQHLQLPLDPTEEDERQVLLQLLQGQQLAQSPQDQEQARLAWWPRHLAPQM